VHISSQGSDIQELYGIQRSYLMPLIQNNDDISRGNVPSTPWALILIALLFVPGVYLVLLVAAFVPLYMWWELVRALSGLPGKSGSEQSLSRMIGFGAIIAAYACLRGVWMTLFRRPRFELALRVDLNQEPKLDSFILDVCNSLKTSTPDSVILHAEPTFFVQSGRLKVLNAEVKGRVLAISLPLLSGLSLNELRAILVHEFAHFTGRDTLYSRVVLPVYIGTQASMQRLLAEIKSKAEDLQGNFVGFFMKIPMVVPYAILWLYLKIFQLLDLFISRLREKRADFIAATTCGSRTFASALRKVVRLSRSFYTLSHDQIVDLLKDDKAYINYYAVFRNTLPQIWEWSSTFEQEALSENQLAFSSHPTLRTRLRYIPDSSDKYNDTENATSLIVNLDTYEKTLTESYTQLVAMFSADEVRRRKQQSMPKQTVRVRTVKCPHCYMRTYRGSRCDVCGKPLTSVFDEFDC